MLPVYLYEQFSSVLFLSTDENCICGCCTAIGFVFATMPLTGVVLLGWSSFEFHGQYVYEVLFTCTPRWVLYSIKVNALQARGSHRICVHICVMCNYPMNETFVTNELPFTATQYIKLLLQLLHECTIVLQFNNCIKFQPHFPLCLQPLYIA